MDVGTRIAVADSEPFDNIPNVASDNSKHKKRHKKSKKSKKKRKSSGDDDDNDDVDDGNHGKAISDSERREQKRARKLAKRARKVTQLEHAEANNLNRQRSLSPLRPITRRAKDAEEFEDRRVYGAAMPPMCLPEVYSHGSQDDVSLQRDLNVADDDNAVDDDDDEVMGPPLPGQGYVDAPRWDRAVQSISGFKECKREEWMTKLPDKNPLSKVFDPTKPRTFSSSRHDATIDPEWARKPGEKNPLADQMEIENVKRERAEEAYRLRDMKTKAEVQKHEEQNRPLSLVEIHRAKLARGLAEQREKAKPEAWDRDRDMSYYSGSKTKKRVMDAGGLQTKFHHGQQGAYSR